MNLCEKNVGFLSKYIKGERKGRMRKRKRKAEVRGIDKRKRGEDKSYFLFLYIIHAS